MQTRRLISRPHPHRSPHSRPHADTQLSKLQEQYLEGKHTDMVIRVRVVREAEEPPAATHQEGAVDDDGKPRMGGDAAATSAGATAAAAAAATPVADAYTDIKAHVLVLCTLSPYFDRALGGEWAEAAERRVELTVADEQELEDLEAAHQAQLFGLLHARRRRIAAIGDATPASRLRGWA